MHRWGAILAAINYHLCPPCPFPPGRGSGRAVSPAAARGRPRAVAVAVAGRAPCRGCGGPVLWLWRAGPRAAAVAAPCCGAARTGGGSIARQMAAAVAARAERGGAEGGGAGRPKPLFCAPSEAAQSCFAACSGSPLPPFHFGESVILKNAVSTSSWCRLRRQGHLCLGAGTKASEVVKL